MKNKGGRNSQFILPRKFPLLRLVISKGFFVPLIVVTNENTTQNTGQMKIALHYTIYDILNSEHFYCWNSVLLNRRNILLHSKQAVKVCLL